LNAGILCRFYRNKKLSKMRRKKLKNRFWLLLSILITPLCTFAQSTADCDGAVIVCGDMAITLAGGAGQPDFNNPNNDLGDCHLTGEEESVWLYFRFKTDMPDNSILEFTITPFNGAETDYDFSIYAANSLCDSLGSPIRCSYAWTFSNNAFSCGFCPLTGLGNGETDVSEGPFGNGFLAPLVVQPGQGFYIYINEFFDEDNSSGFHISFGGSAAAYFDCDGNPNCDLVTVDIGPDQTFCNQGTPYQLITSTTFTTGFESYSWQGANGEEAFMNNPNSPSPLLTFPDDFSGLVELSLVVSNGDCIHYDTLRLEVLPRLFMHIEGTDTLCLGNTGLLDAGPGFDSYLWSTGSTAASIAVNQGGQYAVTVTGNGGRCALSDTMAVVEISLPAPNLPSSAMACAGDSITLGPAGLFTAYQWNTGDTTFDITVYTSGYYFLTVTNQYGCSGVGVVDVDFLPSPSPQLQGSYGFCPGAEALVSAMPGQGSYLWSTNETTTQISVQTPGDYSLTVTAPNGCQTEAAFTVAAYPEPMVQIDGSPNLCEGEQATLQASQGFASYQWQDGSADPQLDINSGGLYSLVATDANGCVATDSLEVTLLPLPDINVPTDLAFCENSMLVIDAGPGYAAYQWSNGGTGQSIQVQQAGQYGLTLTDTNGCQDSGFVDVAELPLPVPALAGELFFCQSASTTLNLSVPGGYDEIIWSDGTTGPTATFDTPGTYTVWVQAPNGCAVEQAFAVFELVPTPVGINGDTLICEGNTAMLDAGGGYASYLWSSGDTTSTIETGLGGQYAITVTNALGCEGWDTITLAVQELPVIDLGADSAFICRNQSIVLDAGSGLASYLWSTGATTSSIQVAVPGNYEVAVSDDLGCTAQAVIEVIQPAPPQPMVIGDLNLCPGDTSTISVGSDYPAYQWSTGANGPSIDVAQAGFYQLTVTDEYGCSGSVNIIVNMLWAPILQIAGARGFCLGGSTVLDAGNHYSYLWSNGHTGPTITANTGGEYSVTVSNSIGCASSLSVEVEAWVLPSPELPEEIEFCTGESVAIQAAPGYASYEWQDGTSGNTYEIDAPGWYSVQVTDLNGCTQRDSVLAAALPLPQFSVMGIQPICDGTPLSLSVTGAVGNIFWSTGSTDSSIIVDRPGNYFVELVDSTGCKGRRSFLVDTLASQALSIQGDVGLCPGASAVISGADGFSNYTWSNGTSGQALTVTEGGIYQLSAVDPNGCRAHASWQVELFGTPIAAIAGQTSFCEGSTTTLQAIGSFPSYLWSTGEVAPLIETSQAGSYTLIVGDANGCRDTAEIALEMVLLPLAEPGPGGAIDCREASVALGNGGSAPNLAFQWAGPDIGPNNANLPSPNVQIAGLYTLIVTDTLSGCVSLAAEALVEDLRYEPEALVVVENNLDCSSPTALLNGQGSANGPAYAYQWLDAAGGPIAGANSLIFSTSIPGQYSLVVTDTATGCFAQAAAEVISDFSVPQVEAGQGGLLTCTVLEWQLAGTTSLNGPQISIAWATTDGLILEGEDGLNPIVSQPGWYILTVSNLDNGCQASDSVFVQQDIEAPTAHAGTSQYLDCATDEATLDGSLSSRGSSFQYQWVSENGFSVLNALQTATSLPGAYALIVTNLENGCSSSDTALVELIDNFLTGFDAEILPPRCFGEENGFIAINAVNGGTAPFLYSFNGAPFSSQSTFSALGPGQYEIQVQDARGCEYALAINLPEGNIVQLELGDNIEIKLGEEAWLHAITNLLPEEIGSFNWAPATSLPCDTCLLVKARPLESTLYTATITDKNGCRATDKLRVIVRKDRGIYIPNAFSPNLDGNNDEFIIFGGKDVVQVRRLTILDRWGEVVFEQKMFPPNNPAYGWNGIFRGQPLQPAVFTFFAEVEFIDGAVDLFKGSVTLVK
jgi:gliding motility-associated-like protein